MKRLADATVASAALAAMYALKSHYGAATPEELAWILRPTTALVGWATGAGFVFEPHVGFTSTTRAVVIAPACAGVNFLVITFATLVFGFVAFASTPGRKVAWLAASAAIAYAVTIGVNALRIVCGMAVRHDTAVSAWATPATVHRVLGTVIYLTAVWVVFVVTDAAFRRAAGGTS